MRQIPRKQAQVIAGVVFVACFILAFVYAYSKSRLELEDAFEADVEKAYHKAIRDEMVPRLRAQGEQDGYTTAEPDPELLEKKHQVEKQLLDIKQKAMLEMQEYDRDKICQIAYRSGIARGEGDARKNWSADFWDEKTGIGIGKILSIGKKVVRVQLKYRNFPVGAPLETETEREAELSSDAVCGLLKGIQWSSPVSYQFFEGIKSEVCSEKKLDKGKVASKDEANKKFWDSLPPPPGK
jgi:hypothetical protein